MSTVHKYISNSVSRKKKGELIFPADFRGKGSGGAIKMALSRLAKEGILTRLAHGIYYIPKEHELFGVLYPAPEEVAQTIAKKEKVRIKPAGAYALHRLGLSTQVPTKLVYLTDGEPRLIKIGKSVIRFKSTTPKKMSMKGAVSSLVIQALEELGIKAIDPVTRKKIRMLLQKEDVKQLQRDLKLAPSRIHDYIINLLKEAK